MDATSRAALGAIVGVTLGMPHKGRASIKAVDGYRPVPSRMASDEGLDAWIVVADLISPEPRVPVPVNAA